MSDSGTAFIAAHVMMNTTISASTGGLTVFIMQRIITKKYDCAALCNGILAGLVSITAGCSNVESGSSVLIGLLGGCIVIGSSALVKKIKIDDPVDAFSVHGACGIWGCLAAALFDYGSGTNKHHGWGGFSATSYEEDGEVRYMTTGDAFVANVCEVVFIMAWSGGLSSIIFGALRIAGLLRVDKEHEELGCDSECVSPRAYNINPPEPKREVVVTQNLTSLKESVATAKIEPGKESATTIASSSSQTSPVESPAPSEETATDSGNQKEAINAQNAVPAVALQKEPAPALRIPEPSQNKSESSAQNTTAVFPSPPTGPLHAVAEESEALVDPNDITHVQVIQPQLDESTLPQPPTAGCMSCVCLQGAR
jgi:hypothetical protein